MESRLSYSHSLIIFFLVKVILFEYSSAGIIDTHLNLADVPCGKQWKRKSRIIGGENAIPGEFPWLVSIKRRGGGHFCGGTIVSKRWMVTAGHCMCSGTTPITEDKIFVTAGEHDLRSKSAKASNLKVAKIHFHPKYCCPRYVDDIALLELEEDLIWSRSVRPACLPIDRGNLAQSQATTAGWGWLREDHGQGTQANILQKVQVTIFGNPKCQDWYSSSGKKVKILDSQICAGNEAGGKDACWADSGGPLMVSDSGKTTVVGVVSTGIGCGRPKLPGLYTRMSEYIPWMVEVMEGR